MSKLIDKCRDKCRRVLLRERASGDCESLDPTPLEIPGSGETPLTLREEMQRFIRQELSKQAESAGAGSFEEEDDFEEENSDIDLLSPYTVLDLHPEENAGLQDTLDGAPVKMDEENISDNPPGEPGGEAAEAEGETPEPARVANA